jgi:DNA-binding transcriptional ArsR family regulator
LSYAQDIQQVSFHVPAKAGPDVAATNATWVLIVFSGTDTGSFRVDFPAPSRDVNTTLLGLLQPNDDRVFGKSESAVEDTVPTERQQNPFRAQASFSGAGSLYVHGAGLRLQVQDGVAYLAHQTTYCLDMPFPAQERAQREARYRDLCPEPGTAAIWRTGPMQVMLEAQAVDVVEWHHADLACRLGPCPDGGQRTISTVSTPALNITNRVLSYHQLQSHDASLSGTGQATRIVVGGAIFDLAVHGWMRLPLAQAAACAGCIVAENQTLYGEGNMELRGLHRDGDVLSAGMGGTLTAARVDEQGVSVGLEVAAGIGLAGLATLAALAFFRYLVPLFSRVAPELVSGKRVAILDFIKTHPGITTKDLREMMGMTDTTIRHHLLVLQAGGHIIERRQLRLSHYFENHGRYGEEWAVLALLRDDKIKTLHDWLLQQREVSTPTAVQHAKTAWGWTAGATYKRLRKLKKAGLVVSVPDTTSPSHASASRAVKVTPRSYPPINRRPAGRAQASTHQEPSIP